MAPFLQNLGTHLSAQSQGSLLSWYSSSLWKQNSSGMEKTGAVHREGQHLSPLSVCGYHSRPAGSNLLSELILPTAWAAALVSPLQGYLSPASSRCAFIIRLLQSARILGQFPGLRSICQTESLSKVPRASGNFAGPNPGSKISVKYTGN